MGGWFNYALCIYELDAKTIINWGIYGNMIGEIYSIDEDARYFVPDGNGEGEWDSQDQTMVEISRRYPDYVFVLSESNDDDDDFKIYYYRGCRQVEPAGFTYGDFDLEKLAEVEVV